MTPQGADDMNNKHSAKRTPLFAVGDRVITRYFNGEPENIYDVIGVEVVQSGDLVNEWVTIERPAGGIRKWRASEIRKYQESPNAKI